mgnify:CR=1 FL=1
MEIKYTEQELNSIDKTLLIKMFFNLQNQMETLTVETKALNDKMQKMMDQLVLPIITGLEERQKKCLIQTRYVLWK